jgi:hypothetical protein
MRAITRKEYPAFPEMIDTPVMQFVHGKPVDGTETQRYCDSFPDNLLDIFKCNLFAKTVFFRKDPQYTVSILTMQRKEPTEVVISRCYDHLVIPELPFEPGIGHKEPLCVRAPVKSEL